LTVQEPAVVIGLSTDTTYPKKQPVIARCGNLLVVGSAHVFSDQYIDINRRLADDVISLLAGYTNHGLSPAHDHPSQYRLVPDLEYMSRMLDDGYPLTIPHDEPLPKDIIEWAYSEPRWPVVDAELVQDIRNTFRQLGVVRSSFEPMKAKFQIYIPRYTLAVIPASMVEQLDQDGICTSNNSNDNIDLPPDQLIATSSEDVEFVITRHAGGQDPRKDLLETLVRGIKNFA
jgi:hypothetical protein